MDSVQATLTEIDALSDKVADLPEQPSLRVALLPMLRRHFNQNILGRAKLSRYHHCDRSVCVSAWQARHVEYHLSFLEGQGCDT